MFGYISLRSVNKGEISLSRIFQSLSVAAKVLHSGGSCLNQEEASLKENLNKEIEVVIEQPHIQSYIKPKSVSSTVINQSDVLKELFGFGVDIYKVEQNSEAYKHILQSNVIDIQQRIAFLKQFNLQDNEIGKIITKNPKILQEDLDDLQVRINYLQYKKFSDEMITSILKKNPFWLSHR